jgi:hypothetical protein
MMARQKDPMAARFGYANTGFYTDEPKVLVKKVQALCLTTTW